MPKSDRFGVTWKLDPHTKAKHDILKRYLGAWFPIMDRWNGRILYIDGFAGPGQYSKGEWGSPIIALQTAAHHTRSIHHELVCLFIEADEERCAHLARLVDGFPLPPNIKADCCCGRFDEQMTVILDYLDEQNAALAPTFAFIDPFGYSHTPFSVVKRLMKHDRCEVLITFVYDHINRFLSHPDEGQHGHYDDLFDTPRWREAVQIGSPDDRKRFIHDLYKSQLSDVANARYVRSFEMMNRGNRTSYFLFFGTGSYLGLKKMKEAMWRVDPLGGTVFSDTTDVSQPLLFAAEPDYHRLRREIISWCRMRDVTVGEIERFVVVKTGFRETHFKTHILRPLEEEGKLTVRRSPRKRRFTYPDGTVLAIVSDD